MLLAQLRDNHPDGVKIMKNWQIMGVLTFLIIGIVLMSGCTNAGSTSAAPVAVSTPTPPIPPLQPTTEVTTLPHTPVQVAIPQTGVWIKVTYPKTYTGTYGLPAEQVPVTDTGDHVYQIRTTVRTTEGPFLASIKKQDGSVDKLVVAVYNNGSLIKEVSTTAPLGSIELYATLKTPTPTTNPTPYLTNSTSKTS